MQLTGEHSLQLATLGGLLVLSAFFSGSETALMSIDRLRINISPAKGAPGPPASKRYSTALTGCSAPSWLATTWSTSRRRCLPPPSASNCSVSTANC